MNKKRKASGKANGAIDFFSEAGLLKRVKRSGWWVAGIENPESVADHSFRTAVIGYYLAVLENVDAERVVTMALFNDIHEARINDLHKMGHHYIEFKDAEKRVFRDQVRHLDNRIKASLEDIRSDYDAQESPESIVARDADILECLLQAKEYYETGYLNTRHFFSQAPDHLITKSAKKMWRDIKKWNSSQWWRTVVKFER